MNYRYLGNFRFSWCDRATFNSYETFILALDYKPVLKHWNEKFEAELNKLCTLRGVDEIELFRDRFKTLAIILVSRFSDAEYTRVMTDKPNSLWLEAHYCDGFRVTVMDYFKESEVVEVDYRDTSVPYPVFKGQLCLIDLDELLNDTVQLSGIWKF